MSNKPNWLLRGLILVSIGVHALVFMHISGIYKSRTWTYLELTLRSHPKVQEPDIPRPQDVPKPVAPPVQPVAADLKERADPPPKKKPQRRTAPPAVESGKPLPREQPVASAEPSRIRHQEESYPESIAESILPAAPPAAAGPTEAGPEIARAADPEAASRGADQRPRGSSEPGDAATADAYFAMVRSRIESHKAYPESARMRNLEGKVVVGFILQTDGTASSIEIRKKSAHNALNQAALDAVRKASPFPRPPAHLFQKAIPLQLAIAFELR
jgi:protein TonB